MTADCRRKVLLFCQPVDMGDEEPEPHQLRDVAAVDDVYERVRQAGDRCVRMINIDHEDLAMANLGWLARGDLVIGACRVRKSHVNEKEARKQLPYSGAEFEAVLAGAHDPWIASSSRKRIRLTEAGAKVLADKHEHLADLRFSQWRSADYVNRGRRRTAGYIVFTRELWPGGPDYLNVFGASGPITHGLAHAIRNQCSQLSFTQSELIVVEIWTRSAELPIVPRTTEGRLDYADNWVMAWHRKGAVNYVHSEVFIPRIPGPGTAVNGGWHDEARPVV